MLIYDIFYILFLIFYLPIFVFRRKYHKNFSMRLAIFPEKIKNKLVQNPVIWIHAVSVGEVNSALPVIRRLRKKYPDKLIVISTVTVTGNKTAKKIAGEKELVIYLPLDLSFIINKTLDLINPEIFIIAETEIWPNLIQSLYNRQIPIILINGRISPASYRRYRIIKLLISSVFKKVDLFCMQTEQDALKVISLGANADNVKIAGSTKFDIEVDFKEEELAHLSEKLSITEQDKVVIAGSTHHPEEKIMLNCYRKLVEDFENLKLILVPRHIERTEQIIREAKNQGFQAFKFSQLGKKDKNVNSQPRLIVVDVMGKLKLMYSLATVVFIGGSLAKIGGHNMIEPAFFAKPIIFGPYVFNFQSLAEQLLKAHASYMVKDQDELLDRMRYLLKNRQMRLKLGQNAKKITQKSKGATNKNIGFIESFIAS